MNDEQFFTFVYDQYKADLAAADALYQRAGVLLTAQVVLGGATAALGRVDLLPSLADRPDILLYHLGLLTTFAALATSIVFLAMALAPRRYPVLTRLSRWAAWREEYAVKLHNADPGDAEGNASHLALETRTAILGRLLESQSEAAEHNLKRHRQMRIGILASTVAIASILFTAILAFLLKVQGV